MRYLIHGPKGSRPHPQRVAFIAARNLLTDNPRAAAQLMRATAAQSVRCKAPVYHFLVSWHHNEAPSLEAMRAVADATCADLGLEEHQRLYVGHDDTEHRHVHVVVNRVHPETGKAWNRRQDYVRIERSLAHQSEAMGLAIVPGRHNCRTSPPIVSEMDVMLGLKSMGLVESAQVQALFEERERRREMAPVGQRIEREMRLALRSAPARPARVAKTPRLRYRRRASSPSPN